MIEVRNEYTFQGGIRKDQPKNVVQAAVLHIGVIVEGNKELEESEGPSDISLERIDKVIDSYQALHGLAEKNAFNRSNPDSIAHGINLWMELKQIVLKDAALKRMSN